MLNNFLTKMAQYAIDKPAPFLRYTTAVVYAISAVAQCTGLKINKDIPDKEKNFLMVQEALSGALELGTFMTIATGMENLGAKLVEKGIIVGTEAAKANPAFKKGVAMLFSLVGTVLAFNLITPLLRNPMASFIQKKLNKKISPELQHLTVPVLPSLKLNTELKINANNPFTNFERTLETGKLHNKLNPYTNKLSFGSSRLSI